MVKDLPTNAGNMGSLPGARIFHMPRGNEAPVKLLKYVHAPEPKFCNQGNCCNEKPWHGNYRAASAHYN